MTSDGSITRWIDRLQAGDPAAAQPLWQHYFQLLVDVARRKLGAKPRVADHEDPRRAAAQTRRRSQTAAAEELERVASPEPSPGFAAELAENCQRLLDLLGDVELRTIAL